MTDTTECIRRPRSTWSMCRCPNCRAEAARLAKLARNGQYRRVPAEAAWTVINHWEHRGWSGRAIASAAGLPHHTIETGLVDRNTHGHHRRFSPTTSRLIVEAHVNGHRPTEGRVGAHGTRRRLQALAVQGYGLGALHKLTGIPAMTLSAIRGGITTHIAAARANTITDLYPQLVRRYGGDDRAAQYARDQGWHSAIAWNDPDDPDETPDAGHQTTQIARRIDDIEWLLGLHPHATAQQIADRLGITRSAVQQALYRDNRRDLIHQLNRNAENAA